MISFVFEPEPTDSGLNTVPWQDAANLPVMRGRLHGKSVLTSPRGGMPCSWVGIAGHAQEVEDEANITGEFAACGGHAVTAPGLDQPDGEAPQAGHVFGSVSGTEGTAVFANRGVMTGFLAPVGAVECP